MKNKNPYDMHYKRTGEDIIEVTRPEKFKIYCTGVKSAKHTQYGIELTPTVGGATYTIDEWGHKRYW